MQQFPASYCDLSPLIGGGIWGNSNGTIDSTRIYSRAMSTEEIAVNYTTGNLELQTRSDGSGWEDWKPITNEVQLLALDSDASNWSSSNSNTLALSNDSVIKMEGTGSLKATMGAPRLMPIPLLYGTLMRPQQAMVLLAHSSPAVHTLPLAVILKSSLLQVEEEAARIWVEEGEEEA